MAYQSLYRRYRPQRFSELRGQDHVSKTLRNAVREGRVTHAYLFSGPRGTGKTSTARILAKALNCAAPADGEPCGSCASCVEVAAGTSLDVHELDAASNNGVEAMRDLVSRAALGQVAAAGGVDEQAVSVEEVVEALCERDVGRALVAVAERAAAGHDARQLARDLLEHLRQIFLAMTARSLVGLPDDDLGRLEDQARRLGAPAMVRAMEALGEALVDMRESPDPRITLEVVLVRLCRPDADNSPAALLERIERLERAVGERSAAPARAEVRKAVGKAP